ncbi:Integrase, catalytic core [Cucumis melo var. makuwa]|uniref:Integrase, catalytic core n=1 Tax=Cucumis melo var. makuwa TaxID=1194695 RepID=A0A5D3DC66_CUCMM|nr:Integrase, catalytic core [Cucumis melo var. makuwa]TYK20879.1 Integrase, catalytic core [Cucumis melo var. makuwa]
MPTNHPGFSPMAAMVASSNLNMDSNWYPDSAATNHLINNFNNLFTGSEYGGGNQIYDRRTGQTLLQGLLHGGLYRFNIIPSHYFPTNNVSPSSSPQVLSVVSTPSPSFYPFSRSHQVDIWHRCLGHPDVSVV